MVITWGLPVTLYLLVSLVLCFSFIRLYTVRSFSKEFFPLFPPIYFQFPFYISLSLIIIPLLVSASFSLSSWWQKLLQSLPSSLASSIWWPPCFSLLLSDGYAINWWWWVDQWWKSKKIELIAFFYFFS